MGKDKKVRDGAITLILPRRIGDCFEMRNAPVDQLREFLAEAGLKPGSDPVLGMHGEVMRAG